MARLPRPRSAGDLAGSLSLRSKPSILLACAAIALLAQVGCGSTPAGPSTPLPTPIVTPTPAPTPTPPGVGIPPASSGCGEPYPPPLSEIRMKIHVKAPEYWTLD